MAKKTKSSNLSIEERLEQALIPDGNAPYKLPDNWKFIVLSDAVTRIKRGKAPKYVEASDFPVFAQKCNQKDGTISIEKAKFLDPALVEKFNDEEFLRDRDIVINSTGTGTLGRVGYYRAEYASSYEKVLPDSHVTVVRTSSAVDPQYLYFFLKNSQDYLESQGVGSTNQKELRPEVIGGLHFPLPPYAEQQRIVKRVESLFSKLDEAKEKAQEVVDGFEARKAAILHKAFNGKMTAKWRAEHNMELDGWQPTALQNVCEKIVCGKTPKEYITEHGEIPYLKVYNIVNNQIDFNTTPQFIPKEIHGGRLQSSILKPNDVIMNIVGPPLRKIAIIPDTYPEWNMNQAIVRFRPLAALNHRFLYYALINPETLDDVIAATKGVVGQANISVSQSRNLTISIPSLEEQIEIVRILDSLFVKEKQVKEAAELMLEKITLMKKAILARAFRGELGTNDPAEESSIELLKAIVADDKI